jgi:hypothetical protein
MNDIRTPPATDKYRKGFDRIFGKGTLRSNEEAPCYYNDNPGTFIVKAIERSLKKNRRKQYNTLKVWRKNWLKWRKEEDRKFYKAMKWNKKQIAMFRKMGFEKLEINKIKPLENYPISGSGELENDEYIISKGRKHGKNQR